MEKKENKYIKTFLKLLIVLVLMVVIYMVWNKTSKKAMQNNNVEFYQEYTRVAIDNIYKYATKEEILEAFDKEKAVVLFGFPTCKWCQEYVVHLNDIAKEYGATEILYYNIKEDRASNSNFYQEVVKRLEKYLHKDEEGNARIYVPDVYFIKNGEIIGHNNDTSTIANLQIEEYYTKENVSMLHDKLNQLFSGVFNCDDTKGC